MPLLLNFWRELTIIALCSALVLTYLSMENAILSANSERDQYKQALDFQNATLLNDAKKYEEKLKQLPKERTKIKTKYEVIYAEISDFKKDENETDCDASLRFLNSTNY